MILFFVMIFSDINLMNRETMGWNHHPPEQYYERRRQMGRGRNIFSENYSLIIVGLHHPPPTLPVTTANRVIG